MGEGIRIRFVCACQFRAMEHVKRLELTQVCAANVEDWGPVAKAKAGSEIRRRALVSGMETDPRRGD